MPVEVIAVNPESLEGTAQKFYDAEEQLQTTITKLCTAMEALFDEWDGVTQQRFYKKWYELSPDFAKFPDVLREAGEQMNRIAEAFRGADKLELWYHGL